MEYRRSSYCIITALEDSSDKYMMIHSYTGAIDIVSENIVSFLKKYSQFSNEDIPFSRETFDMLTARGYITTKTKQEEQNLVQRFATLLHKSVQNTYKQYMFLVSYDCNFRCSYCYEGGISKQGKQWSKKTFTKELVDRAYEAMEEIEPDEKKRGKHITLYGGEPFLKENVEIVEYIINKGVQLGYSFEAITNGHDINHFEQVFSGGAIKHIQITLDGGEQMHDSRRYHYLTGNSFDKVFKNIEFALNNNVSVSVRFNVDANNFGEIKKLKDLFDDVGYSQKPHFSFNTALLRKDETCITPESSLLYASQEKTPQENTYDEDIAYISRTEFNLLHKKAGMEVTLQDYGLYQKLFTSIKYGTYLRFHSVFCGVQAHLYVFDPYGDIYNCWEAVGIKSHILGNYIKKVTWTEELKNWQERNVSNTPQCSICKYALLCGGGCVAKALRLPNRLGFKASYCDNYGDILKITVNKIYKDWQQNLLIKENSTEFVKKEIEY